ncbi:hypothetical protein RSC3_01640 [Bacillus paralicheniformis]|nr:hypothetical protein RSC3_01640 [Bacillus paralicheniformis]
MANQNAQSSIDEFKQFIKRHPKLISEVRKQEKSWQEVYENWVLLGKTIRFGIRTGKKKLRQKRSLLLAAKTISFQKW